ncbi:MAG: thioredoxin family protein [bacterium]
MSTIDWARHLADGLTYVDFLARYDSSEHHRRWQANHSAISLTADQKNRLALFTRRMGVLCLSGTWCGDCASQCPIYQHIVEAAPPGLIDLRFIDRDAAPPDLAAAIRINGGQRVPALIFISEDGFEVARYGEKTLAKYRDEAARLGGVACSIGLVSEAENTLRQAVIAEWVDQFERAQLILRLSARLRQKYND